MPTSILSRKRDLVYLVHFAISLPMMFAMDLQAVYPSSMVPGFMTALKEYYLSKYNDRFFLVTPPYFSLFIWSEIVVQVPMVLWALGGLWRDSPKVPLVLLPYAMLVFISTAVCMVEFWQWEGVPFQEKWDLSTLYGPYLALSAFMVTDMILRLNAVIEQKSGKITGEKKKGQ